MAANVGGTGAILRGNAHINRPKPKTSQLDALIDKGRVGLYTFEVVKGQFLLCYIVYGYPNAEKDDEAAARTCDLPSMILHDSEQQDPGPKLIVGDLNAPIERVPSLEAGITQGSWIDVGANGSVNGGSAAVGTCRSNTPGARFN